MNSQWNTASRTAGIEQQRSGSRFTPMWTKSAVSTLGAVCGFCGGVDGDAVGGLPYRQLADGDGH